MLALGTDVIINDSDLSVATQLSAKKAIKWSKHLRKCLADDCVTVSDAQKFAGRFGHAAEMQHDRCGRAYLRPFYAQANMPMRWRGDSENCPLARKRVGRSGDGSG